MSKDIDNNNVNDNNKNSGITTDNNNNTNTITGQINDTMITKDIVEEKENLNSKPQEIKTPSNNNNKLSEVNDNSDPSGDAVDALLENKIKSPINSKMPENNNNISSKAEAQNPGKEAGTKGEDALCVALGLSPEDSSKTLTRKDSKLSDNGVRLKEEQDEEEKKLLEVETTCDLSLLRGTKEATPMISEDPKEELGTLAELVPELKMGKNGSEAGSPKKKLNPQEDVPHIESMRVNIADSMKDNDREGRIHKLSPPNYELRSQSSTSSELLAEELPTDENIAKACQHNVDSDNSDSRSTAAHTNASGEHKHPYDHIDQDEHSVEPSPPPRGDEHNFPSSQSMKSLSTATQTHDVRMPMFLPTFKPATGCTNASDFIVRCFVARLRAGITVVKHGRSRWCKSRLRILHVHSDGRSLSWKPAIGEPSSSKRPPKLELSTCVEVRHAWSPDPHNNMFTGTPILRQKCEAANAHKSFALIFPKRTVDITAVTADQCRVLMEGFSALCFRLHVANLAGKKKEQPSKSDPHTQLEDDRDTASNTLTNNSNNVTSPKEARKQKTRTR